MEEDSKRRHLFISHHHNDDEAVSKLTKLCNDRGYDIRNSSIRAKPANAERLQRGLVKEEVIQRLLRMKISWATTVVVLIGKETHQRPWVNWEIKEAYEQGKRIVGVYERGGKEAALPSNLDRYGDSIVAWNSERIIAAIDGENNRFENSDGSERAVGSSNRTEC
ncbi:MAG: TIR domain-containing protein [Myxococcota bacterium]